jgi:hypothetical protein
MQGDDETKDPVMTENDSAPETTAAAPPAADAAKKGKGINPNKVKSVDHVFATNPRLDVYYKTSDGVAFYTRNAAENHAAGLKDKTVKTITR